MSSVFLEPGIDEIDAGLSLAEAVSEEGEVWIFCSDLGVCGGGVSGESGGIELKGEIPWATWAAHWASSFDLAALADDLPTARKKSGEIFSPNFSRQ